MPKIQMRRDTAANWKVANPILLAGEWALETDTRLMKIGDGTTSYNSLPYSTAEDSDEWQKPADWIDIRSGAQPNSIYFLVGHSADYATYPQFGVQATVSNSGTYDVFVDGIKQATAASGTITTLDWQTLALGSGWDVTTPAALRSHIVRVTPSDSTNEINSLKTIGSNGTDSTNSGMMWAHFTLANTVSLDSFAKCTGENTSTLQSVTSSQDVLYVSSLRRAFFRCAVLEYVVGLDAKVSSISLYQAFFQCANIKKIRLQNGSTTYHNNAGLQLFYGCTALEKVVTNNFTIHSSQQQFMNNYKLKTLPNFQHIVGCWPEVQFSALVDLQDTIFDLSNATTVNRAHFLGYSTLPVNGLKGLTVSNEAPFTGTSPQINVNYTGLDRAALVNLFKSMPHNVGYAVVGSPSIADGVASEFSAENYIKLSQTVVLGNNFEVGVKVITGNSFKTSEYIFSSIQGGAKGIALYTNSGHGLALLGYDSNNNAVVTADYSYPLQINTVYYIKLTFDGSTYIVSLSTDGQSFTPVISKESPAFNESALPPSWGANYTFGSGWYWSGSIDLNNTYIKINGIPWFMGQAAATKTVSVVGCPGTADLTQADKDIALNKGWSITLS